MIRAWCVTYLAVLAAEVVGDKFPYTAAILATRYRRAPMMVGMAFAFMIKMGVAVAFGDAIRSVPRPWLAAVTMATCILIAARVWRGGESGPRLPTNDGGANAVVVSCAAVLGSEWADLGQIAAATMAAQYRLPVLVWLGAVAAMMTKAALAVAIGAEVRHRFGRYMPDALVQYGGASVLFLLGVLSAAETLFAR